MLYLLNIAYTVYIYTYKFFAERKEQCGMKNIITIANQKGGVSKSTTAHALGSGLILNGYKVLFIDLDPQGNLSYTMNMDASKPTVYELMTQRAKAVDVIQKTSHGDLIPAISHLSVADIELNQIGKEYRLKEALQSVKENYDYIIIDTPPALGILTVNALTASNGLIIPAQADVYSLQGIGQLYSTVSIVKTYCNPLLAIKGILLTRYNPKIILNRDLRETIQETAAEFETKVYKTVIREGIAIKEAQAKQRSIYDYAPKSNASLDYTSFVNEFLAEENIPHKNKKRAI